MTRVFCNILKRKITDRVKGKVHITVIDDTLIIDISDTLFSYWKYTIEELQEKICEGLTTDEVCDDFIKYFRKSILRKYFK